MTVPKGVKMPQDHKTPVQAEAEDAATVDIEYSGVTLTFPADFDDWPVRSVIAFEEGRAGSAIRDVLDPVQWADLMKTRPVKRDLDAIFEMLAEKFGMDNSPN